MASALTTDMSLDLLAFGDSAGGQFPELGVHDAGLPGEMFATIDKALDERTIGHNPERLCLLKVTCIAHSCKLTGISQST